MTDIDGESHPLIKLPQLKGYLGLQNHSTEVKFRNLRIGQLVKSFRHVVGSRTAAYSF